MTPVLQEENALMLTLIRVEFSALKETPGDRATLRKIGISGR
jgi:hypothetical protein